MPHNETRSGPDKAALRSLLRARRSSLAPAALSDAGRAVRARLEALAAWKNAGQVLAYCAFKGEIPTLDIIADLWRRGVSVLLPRCRPGERGVLDVACVSCLEELRPGAYGILEPSPEACAAPGSHSPDVALIPAVAFDRAGARLGFGQGYYDRLLAGPGFERTLLIGLAHEFQVLGHIPADPWDRPVHLVVTPGEVIRVR